GRPRLLARRRRQRQEGVQACRAEVLAAFLGAGAPAFLSHPEPPAEYDVAGDWQPAGPSTWGVPPGCDPQERAARGWVATPRAWCLYLASAPIDEPWPDVSRCGAAELLAWMQARSLRALVASFHDDVEWVVVFRPALP